VLTRESGLEVLVGNQSEFGFEQRRRRLEAGVRGRRGKCQRPALQVGGRLDVAAGRHDDFHLVTHDAAIFGHRGERHEARAVHRHRISAGVDARNVQTAGAHGLVLCRIGLNGKEDHFFARHLGHVFDEFVPDFGIHGRILYRRVGENNRVRIHPVLGVHGQVSDQISIAIAVPGIQSAAIGTLGRGRPRSRSDSEHGGNRGENQLVHFHCASSCCSGYGYSTGPMALREHEISLL